eukprot:6188020-Pleurochrysis_carterae.AAC.2
MQTGRTGTNNCYIPRSIICRWLRTYEKDAAQLGERGLIKNLGEAVGHLIARTDKVRFGRAVELPLAEIVLPALVVLILLRGAGV